MSWVEDALKQSAELEKAGKPLAEDAVDLSDQVQLTALQKELRHMYDNATLREIDRALDKAQEHFDAAPSRKELMVFLRTKLED